MSSLEQALPLFFETLPPCMPSVSLGGLILSNIAHPPWIMYVRLLDWKDAPARARVISCICGFGGVRLAMLSQTHDGKVAVAEGLCSMIGDDFQMTVVDDEGVGISKKEYPARVVAPR